MFKCCTICTIELIEGANCISKNQGICNKCKPEIEAVPPEIEAVKEVKKYDFSNVRIKKKHTKREE